MTTTRHKRLGSPSENCSVMRLGIGEDGAKILNIEQSRKERPASLFLPPPPPMPQVQSWCKFVILAQKIKINLFILIFS